jgi:predicted DNA repair protein MutK
MCGGAYLCFEGAEKLMEVFGGHGPDEEVAAEDDPASLEKATVAGAVRTDLILSGEIMAIALADVAAQPILTQAAILAVVGVAMTVAVYGVVGLIVKMDDIGLHLAERPNGGVRVLGRGLVKGMPVVMSALSIIGTAAMLWVGGGILVHGTHTLGLHWPAEPLEHLAHAVGAATGPLHGVISWAVTALGSAIIGVMVGGAIAVAVHQLGRLRSRPAH